MLPIDGDESDVQYLLNAFVILNILEILGILGLAHLDHKQRQAASRRSSALLPSTVDESDEDEPRPGKEPGTDDENWQAEASEHSRHRRSSTFSSRRAPLPSSSSPEQSIPLLDGHSRSSTVRGSRYLVEAVVEEEEPSRTPVRAAKILRTKAEVRRGEVFAVLCGVLIAFAWILFMGTAWLKLRSKEERGGSGGGNFTSVLTQS